MFFMIGLIVVISRSELIARCFCYFYLVLFKLLAIMTFGLSRHSDKLTILKVGVKKVF
jgi:hypothetical protein